MIYLFDKRQEVVQMIENSDLTEGTLDLKINQAAKLDISLPPEKSLDKNVRYLGIEHPLKDGQFLLLRLMTIKDNDNSVDYSFYELAYQELGTYTYIQDRRFPKGASANDLMSVSLSGSPWQLGQVNVPGNLQTNFYYISNLEAINTVTQGLGGEVVFYVSITGNKITGRYMDYLYQQGNDTSKVFVHGDNLLTVDRTGDNSSVYTAILPRGKGEQVSDGQGDSPDGYGRRINIQDIAWSKDKGDPLDKPSGDMILVDPVATEEYGHIDGNERLLIKTYDNIDDTTELINTAYRELMASNHPSVQYSATVAETGGLGLGDTVLIMHNDRNLSYKTRVFEVSVDLVRPENSSLKLGDDLSSNSLTSTISSISSNALAVSNGLAWTFTHGGHNDTTYSPVAPNNPRQGNVWYKPLPNGTTELYYWDGNAWILSAETDSQWRKNSAELNGDHTVYRGPDEPVNPQQGDTWFKNDVNEKNGIAMYSYSGKEWIKYNGSTDATKLQQGIIDANRVNVLNLDANNISTGHLSANFIKGGQIDASQLDVINLNANSLISGTIDAYRIGVINLNANNITTGNLSADYIKGGTIDANDVNVVNLKANNITSGNLSADYIKGGTIDANDVNIVNLKADNITSGSISADKVHGGTIDGNDVNVTNIKANNITSGSMSADKIHGGSIDANDVNINNLNVDKLVGNTADFVKRNFDGNVMSTHIDWGGMTVNAGNVSTHFNSNGLDTSFGNGGYHIGYGSNDRESGMVFGLNNGTNYISFGFGDNGNYDDDGFLITRNGSPTADKYNIGGGAVFKSNVSFQNNIYWKPGTGIYQEWDNYVQAIRFNTINGGIPAIVNNQGAGIAFGQDGQLYLLAHGEYVDFSNQSIRGSFNYDHPNA